MVKSDHILRFVHTASFPQPPTTSIVFFTCCRYFPCMIMFKFCGASFFFISRISSLKNAFQSETLTAFHDFITIVFVAALLSLAILSAAFHHTIFRSNAVALSQRSPYPSSSLFIVDTSDSVGRQPGKLDSRGGKASIPPSINAFSLPDGKGGHADNTNIDNGNSATANAPADAHVKKVFVDIPAFLPASQFPDVSALRPPSRLPAQDDRMKNDAQRIFNNNDSGWVLQKDGKIPHRSVQHNVPMGLCFCCFAVAPFPSHSSMIFLEGGGEKEETIYF